MVGAGAGRLLLRRQGQPLPDTCEASAAVREGAARLLDRLEPLRESGKLGPLLWQLPETFTRDDERLARALDALPQGQRHCFEFRHPSWFCEPVYQRLRQSGVALVIADHPKRGFQTHELTTRWIYIRFHMGRRGRDGNYSRAELESWAAQLRAWSDHRRVYAYFNNDWRAFAPRNAAYLKTAVDGERYGASMVCREWWLRWQRVPATGRSPLR